MNPGASAFSVIPAPAHSALTAALRHQQFNAYLALAYRSKPTLSPWTAVILSKGAVLLANSNAAPIALRSSRFRQASTIAGSVGVYEAIEDTTTARGAGLA